MFIAIAFLLLSNFSNAQVPQSNKLTPTNVRAEKSKIKPEAEKTKSPTKPALTTKVESVVLMNLPKN